MVAKGGGGAQEGTPSGCVMHMAVTNEVPGDTPAGGN